MTGTKILLAISIVRLFDCTCKSGIEKVLKNVEHSRKILLRYEIFSDENKRTNLILKNKSARQAGTSYKNKYKNKNFSVSEEPLIIRSSMLKRFSMFVENTDTEYNSTNTVRMDV